MVLFDWIGGLTDKEIEDEILTIEEEIADLKDRIDCEDDFFEKGSRAIRRRKRILGTMRMAINKRCIPKRNTNESDILKRKVSLLEKNVGSLNKELNIKNGKVTKLQNTLERIREAHMSEMARANRYKDLLKNMFDNKSEYVDFMEKNNPRTENV